MLLSCDRTSVSERLCLFSQRAEEAYCTSEWSGVTSTPRKGKSFSPVPVGGGVVFGR